MTTPETSPAKQNIGDKIKDYYAQKKMWWRYLVLVGLLLLTGIQLFGKEWGKQNNTNSTPVITNEYSEGINFAWEVVPFDDGYFFNGEKLDREVAITQLNVAQFVMIYKRAPRYLPYITEELKKAGINEDFQYLVIAESALRNTAQSSAWAWGLWQFMPTTAERYGLTVNSLIDERLDTKKSTKAAIAYLQDLYEDFGNWTLVAAAYNRWENGLQRDMERQKWENYYDLSLNEETARYVFRILALKQIIENQEQYFSAEVLGTPYELPTTKTVKVKSIPNVAIWAKEQGSTYHQVRLLNPWIVGNEVPEGKWEVLLFKQ